MSVSMTTLRFASQIIPKPGALGRPHFHLLLVPPPHVRAFISKETLDGIWKNGITWIDKVWYRRIHAYIIKYAIKGQAPYDEGWRQAHEVEGVEGGSLVSILFGAAGLLLVYYIIKFVASIFTGG
ncbi:MAG: hypothetical protein QXI60_08200 [Thermofilaceae archaeon]